MLVNLFRPRRIREIRELIRERHINLYTREELADLLQKVYKVNKEVCSGTPCSMCPLCNSDLPCHFVYISAYRPHTIYLLKKLAKSAPTDEQKYGNMPL